MLILPDKNAVALKLKNPRKVTEVIPHARVMDWRGVPITLVPHNLDETLVLRNNGFDIPSPVLYKYAWSGQYRPFAVQQTTVDMLTVHPRAFVLNDMGSGKTISTLWACDYLKQKGKVNRALIVAPLSTLERAWGDEIFRNFPHLNYAVLHGSREKRLKLLADPQFDLYIVNHDGMEIIADDLARRADIDLIVLDELAVLRNANTRRWKAANAICNKQGIPRRVWGLTGTPTPNAPTDAYAQVKLLQPGQIESGFGRFKDKVMMQISQYIWIPRPDAQEIVAGYMRPAVRFSLEDCVDLPELVFVERNAPMSADQAKAYNQMMTLLAAEVANGEVLAVNEGVKASKLIQIACIEYTTPVLTLRGWVPICEVTANDKVWDGEEWVQQQGAVYKGEREVVDCFSVSMTPDHKVLTEHGWQTAEEVLNGTPSERLDRATVRLPDGYCESRDHDGGNAMRDVALPVRLWEPSGTKKPVSEGQTSDYAAQLWVPSRQRDAQNVEGQSIQQLPQHDSAVPRAKRQGLQKLWGAGHNCLRKVASLIREFLGGYGANPSAGANLGSYQQQWPVFAGELPVDLGESAVSQQTKQCFGGYPGRENDFVGSCGAARDGTSDLECQDLSVQVAPRQGAERARQKVAVYDLINCGPKSRFVVRGKDGRSLIVHNCGVVYDGEGNERVAGAEARLNVVKELIEESASGKAIVFCPFRAVVKYVAEQLSKAGYSVASIDGGTPKGERDRIFSQFQQGKDLQVIVAIPSCMSHGITLTAASTIVWYAPVTSNETFTQANARCHRPGQKHKCVVAMIGGTPIERRYYKRLKDKQSAQGLLLELLRTERK